MERFYRICFLCVAGAFLFLGGMYCSALLFEKNMNETPVHTEPSAGFAQDVIPEQNGLDMVSVSAIPSVDKNTTYIIIKENLFTGEIEEYTEELPSQFVGISREELEEYFENYALSPSLSDREQGFVSAAVETYSANRIVVRKIYEPLQQEERYYLKAEENYVVIYYADQTTVYMYTGIRMDTLPIETQKEIEFCKEITSLESLYSFLESYTS